MNEIRGLLLILLIIGFLGMFFWAWSSKRKAEFDRMANLPLEEDGGVVPRTDTAEE